MYPHTATRLGYIPIRLQDLTEINIQFPPDVILSHDPIDLVLVYAGLGVLMFHILRQRL